MSSFKRPPRAGDQYHDLFSISIIKEWLENTKKYEYLELDSLDRKVKALDDIVAKRSDGLFELIQVKFTVDANKYLLTFDWLLEKKENGTSKLQKWAKTTLYHLDNNRLHSAILKTNRRPDSTFKNSLIDGKLNIQEIPQTVLNKMEQQIGSNEKLTQFCQNFTFHHSENNLSSFENRLESYFIPNHTNGLGWYRLKNEILKWATQRNMPEPDGRIKLQHIKSILTSKRPEAIKQNFIVPENYRPP